MEDVHHFSLRSQIGLLGSKIVKALHQGGVEHHPLIFFISETMKGLEGSFHLSSDLILKINSLSTILNIPLVCLYKQGFSLQ